MKRTYFLRLLAFIVPLILPHPSSARATTLEQIISREHPDFQPERAALTVGRDGLVYLSSGNGRTGYVLRMTPDGHHKIGGHVVYSTANATANANGQIGVASGHFAHTVTIYDENFEKAATQNDFLVSDAVGWDAPAHIEAGAGGDFYGVDQHRDRILRISPAGKLVKSYAIPHAPDGNGGVIQDFRVYEKGELFYVMTRQGPLRAVGFDGQVKWSVNTPSSWLNGGFDVDGNGVLYAIGARDDTIRKYSTDGQPAGEIKLQMGDLKPASTGPAIRALRLAGNDVIIKRNHPTELFARYALDGGKRLGVVASAHERLEVTYDSKVWTAGETIPFHIGFESKAAPIAPRWRIWLRPLNAPYYSELALENDKVRVPREAAGLYQIKVTPETQPLEGGRPAEYAVRGWVEIRAPGSSGTINVMSPQNRVYYAAGETIPLSVIVRTAGDKALPLTLQLRENRPNGAVIAAGRGAADANGVLALSLPSSLTRALRPGNYVVTAQAGGLTAVPQYLIIGAGDDGTAFHLVDHGDYGPTYPAATLWNAPDVVASFVQRENRFGFNLFVDRIGTPLQIGALVWSGAAAADRDALVKWLDSDAGGTSPEKARTSSPLQQVMAAYAAHGLDEMAILTMMDAGLPLGDLGFDNRKPDQYLNDLTRVTKALVAYPSFRGWSWHSNWWIYGKKGSNAARTPGEKAAYEAALKKAKETGAWDKVLDRVSGYRLGYAVEAQELFKNALRAAAPNAKLTTASAGTYRNVDAYPPISFQNVDEVDLQGQFEQIFLPYFPPHAVDFYRRPGKPVWGHPEIWNDSGTGEQIMPMLFAMLMRGADGVGTSGAVPHWSGNAQNGAWREDAREATFGTTSVFRATNDLLRRYGAWSQSLQSDDRVAIAISGRPFKIDEWAKVTGRHFARVMEAWVSCLHAHHPASFVFAEDLKPDSFARYKAILVVGQTVEMEPALADALKDAQSKGIKIFSDGTCRPELVKEYTPLGISFDKFEKDAHPASDDAAYSRFPQYVQANLRALKKALDAVLPPVASIENPEVWASQRTAGDGKYLFVINNSTLPLGPGKLWRTTLLQASRLPVIATVDLTSTPAVVYDVLAMKRVTPRNGALTADLRDLPMRIYALLPTAIGSVALRGPGHVVAGQSFKWWVQIRDKAGKPLATSIPLRVRLLAADGSTLRETFTAAGAGGTSGEWTAPVNGAGDLALEASELFSGETARLAVAVQPTALPVAFDRKFTAAKSDASGKAMSGAAAAVSDNFGPHLRDIAVAPNGKIALLNADNWNLNSYGIDCETGKTIWQGKAGQYFAFAPQAVKNGFVVQGFDYDSAEGYHLYLADEAGHFTHRFALFGLPRRLPHRFVPGLFGDRDDPINNFAVPDEGDWVASAGDLGLVVWERDGTELWRRDWWKSTRHTARLDAPDASTLIVAESGHGVRATACEARSGKTLWTLDLAPTGTVQRIAHSADGKTVALLTDYEGGRVYAVRGGKVVSTLPTAALDCALSPDGNRIAVIEGNQIKLYDVARGLQWIFSGDDILRAPRFAPDGERLAVGSELGTVTVLSGDGEVLFQTDNHALTVPAWLPDGDLLLANWMGRVARLGHDYKAKWSTHLRAATTDVVAGLTEKDATPTARVANWGNAAPEAPPIAPNLLAETKAIIRFVANGRSYVQFRQPYAALVDGKPEAPAEPWLKWADVNSFAEGAPETSVEFDGFRTQLSVDAITLYEDPAHPESWLRDGRLEYWDAEKEQWVFIQEILSDSAVHTHKLAKPVEAPKFRIVIPAGMFGNLRWGEVVFHGRALGASHPDIIARRPHAVLFDESDAFRAIYPYADRWSFQFKDAFSGGRFLRVNANQTIAPSFIPPFGHMVPTWDFEIAENPQPGQYRYLQFAVRALEPGVRGATLYLGGEGRMAKLFLAEVSPNLNGVAVPLGDTVPGEWKTVRVDLWNALKAPLRLQSLYLGAVGGAVGFDQIVLGRTEADLPNQK